MSKIAVYIDDKIYKISCYAGQEDYVAELAGNLHKAILKLKEDYKGLSHQQYTIIAALMKFDELIELKKTNIALQEENRQLLKSIKMASDNIIAANKIIAEKN